MDIGLLRPDNLSQVIVEAAKVVYIGIKRLATTTQLIVEVVDVGQF